MPMVMVLAITVMTMPTTTMFQTRMICSRMIQLNSSIPMVMVSETTQMQTMTTTVQSMLTMRFHWTLQKHQTLMATGLVTTLMTITTTTG